MDESYFAKLKTKKIQKMISKFTVAQIEFGKHFSLNFVVHKNVICPKIQ
jgi:hypothetical protein